MLKKSKMILAIALSITVTFTFIPSTAFASPDKISKAEAKKLYENYKVEQGDIFDFVDKKSEKRLKTAVSTYPEAYDLSDGRITGLKNARNIITPVKLQDPFGTCWAFAATAAAEGSIIGEKTDNGENIDVRDSEYDFSEKHLAWFTVNTINDPEDSQYGEGIVWMDGITSSDKCDQGGIPFYATQQYSSGVGPVYESEYPYRGKNGLIDMVKIGNKLVKYCYSADDDWSIDDSARFHQRYQLEESYMLPTPAGSNEDGEYEFNEAGINAIKDQLINNRPVEMAFYADASTPDDKGEGEYINQKTWAHYTYEQLSANHAVCIVGYDDNYSKDNFNSEHKPPADGAFLVKNSWGSGEEEFPNGSGGDDWGIKVKGKGTGYFWISYYDQSYDMIETLNFNTKDLEDYYVEEYDFMPLNEPMAETSSRKKSMANIFTAEISMRLSAVSCQTSTPGTVVDYKIYILKDDPDNPEDGVLVYENQESYGYGGFHKHDIKDGPIVQKGQKYSVVVTQQDPIGDHVVYMNRGFGKMYAIIFGMGCWEKAVVNKGESYLKSGKNWEDLYNIKKSDEFDKNDILVIDNFPIKAFGDETEQTYIKSRSDITANEVGETITTGVGFTGTGTKDTVGIITWKSSDESVATVKTLEDDSLAEISVKDFGTAYIAATEESLGTAVTKLKVCPKDILCYAKAAHSAIKVTWDESENCNGYTVKYKKSGKYWKSINKSRKKTSTTIKNLSKGTYKVKVAPYAYNSKGEKICGEYLNIETVKVK